MMEGDKPLVCPILRSALNRLSRVQTLYEHRLEERLFYGSAHKRFRALAAHPGDGFTNACFLLRVYC